MKNLNGWHTYINRKYHYVNGIIHNDNGPAIEYLYDGTKIWCQNGKYHRDDGPAFISRNSNQWFKNDKRHREDGPAIEFYYISNNYITISMEIDTRYEWWYDGNHIKCKHNEEFITWVKFRAFM